MSATFNTDCFELILSICLRRHKSSKHRLGFSCSKIRSVDVSDINKLNTLVQEISNIQDYRLKYSH